MLLRCLKAHLLAFEVALHVALFELVQVSVPVDVVLREHLFDLLVLVATPGTNNVNSDKQYMYYMYYM